MAETWLQQFAQLSEDFPLKPSDPADPSLALAIDEGVREKLLAARGDRGPAANPLYVETLLQDCLSRLRNCLTLREKAYDLEDRAVSAALSYKLQKQSIATHSGIARAFDAINAKMAQNAILATYEAGKSSFQGDENAFKSASDLRVALEGALSYKNETVKSKSEVEGNAANYVERFKFLKTLFDLNLVEVYKRAMVIETALKAIYGILATLPDITETGYLNSLAVWAQSTSDTLDLELDSRYVGQIGLAVRSGDDNVIPACQLLAASVFERMIDQQKLEFTLGSAPFDFAGMKDVLLRSLKVEIEGEDLTRVRLWPVVVTLPNRYGKVEQFSTVASSSLGEGTDSEGVVKGVHNVDLRGDWGLKIGPRALTLEATDHVRLRNVYLTLSVSYRKV